jgi:hypothetical protein
LSNYNTTKEDKIDNIGQLSIVDKENNTKTSFQSKEAQE